MTVYELLKELNWADPDKRVEVDTITLDESTYVEVESVHEYEDRVVLLLR